MCIYIHVYYTATPPLLLQMCEYIEKVLHVKSEDLRLYNLTDEEDPVHLDDETKTVADLQFSDGQKLLVESEQQHLPIQHYCILYSAYISLCDFCEFSIICSAKIFKMLHNH